MDDANERLQWLIYGCQDWAQEFQVRQSESVLRYLIRLLAESR